LNTRSLRRWSILGITLLALAARLTNLEAQSLWVDEGIAHIRATLPLETVVSQLLLIATQTPVYYTLMRVWIWVAGDSAFALRFVSVWASTLTVPVVYVAGRAAGGWRAGLLAAALLAFNPFHVWYAQEVRMYALAILLSAGMLIAFIRALHRPGWRWWLVLALVSAPAYLVHWFALTLPAAQFVVFLVELNVLYLRFRRWVVAQALAVLPTLVWVLGALTRRGTTQLRADWIPRPSPLAPLYTFLNYSLGYQLSPAPWLLLGWALFLVAFCLGFRSRPQARWRQTLLACLSVPVGTTFLVSLRSPVYVDRYMSVVLPAFVLWVALGTRTLPRRWRACGSAALVAASVMATALTVSGERYQKEDWRSATRHVDQAALPGDQLFVMGPEDVPVSHYYLNDALPIQVGFPEPSAEGRTWFVYRLPAESNHELGEPAGTTFSKDAGPDVQHWMSANADRLVDRWQYRGLELFLLEG
jgi:4-amino-4-deoxy-L-arabinose transferase-like glycosyltransferase